ncbi:hypothetical protein K3495_g3087 [Podosphaera aphanis]|nr:hypothetical protein K3495_g3087 [Podosphaera aphanis]
MKENPNAKIASVARQFKCQYSLLYNRSRGKKPSSSRGGQNKKLSEPEDQALQDYLLLLHYAGTPANLLELEKAANRLLFFKGKGEKVSARCSTRWMKDHAGFWKQLRDKPMAAKRREAHLKEDIEHHFAEFARCVDKVGIQADDIYNFDETGFQVGVVAGEKTSQRLPGVIFFKGLSSPIKDKLSALAHLDRHDYDIAALHAIKFDEAYHTRQREKLAENNSGTSIEAHMAKRISATTSPKEIRPCHKSLILNKRRF